MVKPTDHERKADRRVVRDRVLQIGGGYFVEDLGVVGARNVAARRNQTHELLGGHVRIVPGDLNIGMSAVLCEVALPEVGLFDFAKNSWKAPDAGSGSRNTPGQE